MNPYSTSFTGYREIPHRAHQNPSSSDHSLSSPHSDSTTQYANSVSPNINESAPSAYDVPFEAWNYTDNYDIKQDDAYGTDPLSVKLEPEEKLSAKSKRIMKRNVAKERTKTRKDAEAFLTGVDPKFLPEGFDDPNLDEKTRKKMIQMVRNRISAQNSRDRKKVFMQQMEDVNSKLEDEITTLKAEKATLMNEITRLQASEAELILENQSLRNNSQNNNNMCSSCRRALQEEDPLYIDDFNNNNNTQQQQQNLEDNFDGNFSTLSSPILSRFASNGKGLFTFFTFAALVCIILVFNVNPTGEVALHGGRKIVTDTRLLEVKNEYCRGPNNYIGDPQDLPYKDSLVIRNMQPLINHFDLNYALTFKSHVQKMALTDSSSASTYTTTTAQKEAETSNGLMMYEEQPKFQNAIVDYDYFKEANLRKKSPTILARNLPQLGQSGSENVKTSTLFCPSGFEFIEQESQNVEIEPRDRILDLENADYLQLFVPRQGLVRYGLHNNVSTLYDLPIASEDSENAMLEIWCKVFLIRDLSSNL